MIISQDSNTNRLSRRCSWSARRNNENKNVCRHLHTYAMPGKRSNRYFNASGSVQRASAQLGRAKSQWRPKVRSAALSEANSIGKKSVAVLVNHMDTSFKRRFGCYFSSSVETRDRPNEMLIFESKHFENKNAALQRRNKRYTSVHQTGGYPSIMSVDLEHHTSACKMSSAQ